jgi:hypothetical protein
MIIAWPRWPGSAGVLAAARFMLLLTAAGAPKSGPSESTALYAQTIPGECFEDHDLAFKGVSLRKYK